MRVLEALKILETAVVECFDRSIETAEVREALDVLEPYVFPDFLVPRFRMHLIPMQRREFFLRQQQDLLKATYGRIYRSIRWKLDQRLQTLRHRQARGDDSVRAELERLSPLLAKMPKRWMYT